MKCQSRFEDEGAMGTPQVGRKSVPVQGHRKKDPVVFNKGLICRMMRLRENGDFKFEKMFLMHFLKIQLLG